MNDILSLIVTGLSIIAAVLAWTIKLVWSKEYVKAKDEIIKSKESQIELLRKEIELVKELNSSNTREFFMRVKSDLEEHVSYLNKENIALKEELEKLKTNLPDEVEDKLKTILNNFSEIKSEERLEELKDAFSKVILNYVDTAGRNLGENIDSFEVIKGKLEIMKKQLYNSPMDLMSNTELPTLDQKN